MFTASVVVVGYLSTAPVRGNTVVTANVGGLIQTPLHAAMPPLLVLSIESDCVIAAHMNHHQVKQLYDAAIRAMVMTNTLKLIGFTCPLPAVAVAPQ